eukprot:COSAG02_NODE_33134_length_505_cov_0.463054_1_plen_69_part_10
MDVTLEPGCPNPRDHPRWIQHRAHLRDAVVSRSRPQAPPANVRCASFKAALAASAQEAHNKAKANAKPC